MLITREQCYRYGDDGILADMLDDILRLNKRPLYKGVHLSDTGTYRALLTTEYTEINNKHFSVFGVFRGKKIQGWHGALFQ